MVGVIAAFLFIVSSQTSLAANANCSDKPVSINVDFDYPGDPTLNLYPGSREDSAALGRISKGFSDHVTYLTDKDGAVGKDQFIAKLRNLAMDSKTVNLNFVGHSLALPNGESVWLLPSIQGHMKDPMMPECMSMFFRKGTPAKNDPYGKLCQNMVSKYVVTGKEIQMALPNKKIFGIMDTCHADGFNLGPNSSVIYSSKNDQVSQNGNNSFTKGLEQQVMNGPVSTFGDIAKASSSLGNANQTPVVKTQDWSNCYNLNKTNPAIESLKSLNLGNLEDQLKPIEPVAAPNATR